MKVLIAPDKFKGTLSAAEAAEAMAEGVAQFNAQWQCILLPIADGGEGTAEILSRASGGEMVKVRASDPLFRNVATQMGFSGDGKTAFIDLSAASGLQALQPSERNPLKTSTIGTGQLVEIALNRRCKRIVIGLGGSATMDCGMGIAHALGAVFSNESYTRLSPFGGNLKKVEFIALDHMRPELKRTEILLLADVDNALLGEDGAMLFAAQKGLQESDRPTMEAGLKHFDNLMEVHFGLGSKAAGMGAGGGAAVCCVAMLGAKIARGADFVLEVLQMPQAIADADLILTGEGHLDVQSLHGKASVALARMAQSQGKHVAAICGQVSLDESALQGVGIDLAAPLYMGGVDVEAVRHEARAMLVQRTREVLEEIAPKLSV